MYHCDSLILFYSVLKVFLAFYITSNVTFAIIYYILYSKYLKKLIMKKIYLYLTIEI